jgi:hypothetical protein
LFPFGFLVYFAKYLIYPENFFPENRAALAASNNYDVIAFQVFSRKYAAKNCTTFVGLIFAPLAARIVFARSGSTVDPERVTSELAQFADHRQDCVAAEQSHL